ncbi:hypothetical protein [Foetidibacter luteolus]|uniref:hypothetical protein n=1 Tax=Foetidibacter luteolus TaxID=2608880 RepID=UPI00129A88EE|nr:hypothetical protein [Foetidibacter luteolus]
MKPEPFIKCMRFTAAALLCLLAGCQAANPITAAFTNQAPVPCNGSTRLPFTASHANGKAITITSFAAVATGPNSDCAKATLLPDTDNRPDVIDLAVIVTCDCTPGQTITVVVTVRDNMGNVMDAWATVTTP